MKQDKNFIWTDELVKKFMLSYNKIDKFITGVDPIMETMQEWKASHSGSVEWEILEAGDHFDNKHPWLKDNSHGGDSCIQVGCKIFSVLRKSDNVTFSVGEKVLDASSQRTIKSFTIDDAWVGKMMVTFNEYSLNRTSIMNISKLPPERTKLFTTQDGVDVYDGMELYSVGKLTFDIGMVGKLTTTLIQKGHHDYYLYFSTRDKAIDFKILNQPCLSVNDVIESCSWEVGDLNYLTRMEVEGLKQIVKTKIKL